jgi:phosphoglycerol transferase MdoB-like AlkP superfamily enzyme
MPLVVGLIYVVQCYSLYLSNSYITALALENSSESRLANSAFFVLLIAIAISGWLTFVVMHYRYVFPLKYIEKSRPAQIGLVFLLIACFIIFFNQPNNTGLVQLQKKQTPILSLAKTGVLLWGRRLSQNDVIAIHNNLYYMKDSEYPLKKDVIYYSELPFERLTATQSSLNVIVLFTEGMSARLIGSYGGKNYGLTPNIDLLTKRAMVVDNYYNHTAATYRGLQGQMASGYPYIGGNFGGRGWTEGDNANSLSRIRYKTLPQILMKNGYETFFFTPHHDEVKLNTLIRSLEFTKVYSFNEINNELLNGQATLTGGSLSDKDLFAALENFLLKQHKNNDKPFFIGAYNIGTHAFFDSNEDGKKYGDGNNSVLNRMHNYDYEFGKFLNYFLTSEYAKNTVLIFTADHATYPEPPTVAAFRGEEYKPYFIDKIPLVVYDPVLNLPLRYDADAKNSLDFTPTLLHLLGINKGDNSFIGRSIFEKNRAFPFSVAAIADDFYAIDKTGPYQEVSMPEKYKKQFFEYKNYINAYYSLEKNNKIFPAE